MIILVGIPSEPPLAMVAAALRRRGADYVYVNQREPNALHIEWEPAAGSGWLYAGRRALPLECITGAYNRSMDPTVALAAAGIEADTPAYERALRCQAVLSACLETAPFTVVNRLRPMDTNASKPFQSQLIRRFFAVPETLVTNDLASVQAFLRDGPVIYKSVSGERSVVTALSERDLPDLERNLATCPVQFQRRIQGINCRVHVVGEQVHACTIESTALDYRYAEEHPPKLSATTLPEDWAQRCRELTRHLGLEFSGIDLIVDESGVPWCLEVNTCPAFSYFEEQTRLPIADAVAQHLSGGRGCDCGCSGC